MRIRLTWHCVGLLLILASTTNGQKKPSTNFYSDVAVTTAAASSDLSPRNKRRTQSGASRPAQKTNSAHSESSASQATRTAAKAESARQSRRPAEKTPAPKRTTAKEQESSKSPTPQAVFARGPAPAAAMQRNYRGDIYGLAAIVTQRWDFIRMLPSLQELSTLRIDSLRRRADMLRTQFTAVSRAAEKQQTNLRNAAIAVYIVSASRRASPSWLTAGGDLSAAQMAVLRATLTSDAQQIKTTVDAYASLREAANVSAEQLAAAESATTTAVALMEPADWIPSRWPRERAGEIQRRAFAVTESLADAAADRTRTILADRAPAAAALQALLNADTIVRQEKARETFRSFAPAPPKARPEYNPLIDPSTPIPTNFGSRHSHPEPAPVLQRPLQYAVVIAAGMATPVLAAADGTVAFADDVRGLGRTVLLDHGNGLVSVYGYLSSFDCAEGDTIKAGQPLGKAGRIPGSEATGIRFELRRGRNSVELSELIGNSSPESLIVGR